MTAPVARPSRSWIGATESSIAISCPSRRTRIQFGGRCTVRSCPMAIAIGLGVVWPVVASRIRRTSAMGRPAASCRGQPVIFSATTLRKVMFPLMSVQTTASPMELSVTWARSFSSNNASSMNLRSMACRSARRRPRGVDLALDETALRAFLQSCFGHGLVFQAREHHQRDVRRGCVDPAYRFKSLRIGQPQIEQDNLDCMLCQMRLGRADARHVRQFGVVRALLVEHLAERAGVCEVVFDQQNRFDRCLAHARCVSVSVELYDPQLVQRIRRPCT